MGYNIHNMQKIKTSLFIILGLLCIFLNAEGKSINQDNIELFCDYSELESPVLISIKSDSDAIWLEWGAKNLTRYRVQWSLDLETWTDMIYYTDNLFSFKCIEFIPHVYFTDPDIGIGIDPSMVFFRIRRIGYLW